jgi:hypothetical protein
MCAELVPACITHVRHFQGRLTSRSVLQLLLLLPLQLLLPEAIALDPSGGPGTAVKVACRLASACLHTVCALVDANKTANPLTGPGS